MTADALMELATWGSPRFAVGCRLKVSSRTPSIHSSPELQSGEPLKIHELHTLASFESPITRSEIKHLQKMSGSGKQAHCLSVFAACLTVRVSDGAQDQYLPIDQLRKMSDALLGHEYPKTFSSLDGLCAILRGMTSETICLQAR